MTSTLGALVGMVLFAATALAFGMIVGQALDWLSMPSRWLASTLPEACSLDDSTWDFERLGWWTEPVLWRPCSGQEGVTSFYQPPGVGFISVEEVEDADPRAWVVLYGARL